MNGSLRFQFPVFTGIQEKFVVTGQVQLAVLCAAEHICLGVTGCCIKVLVGIGRFCPFIDRQTQLTVRGNFLFHQLIQIMSSREIAHSFKMIPTVLEVGGLGYGSDFLSGQVPGSNRNSMSAAQLVYILIKHMIRETAHLHSAASGNTPVCQSQIQQWCNFLGILAVHFIEVANLEQHNLIGMRCFHIVVFHERQLCGRCCALLIGAFFRRCFLCQLPFHFHIEGDIASGCFCLRYSFHFPEVLIVHGVLFQQVKELLPGIYLVEQRKCGVIESYFLVTQGKQFILLGTDIQRIAQGQLVLFWRRGRRIQFIVGWLHGTGNFAVQLFKHGFCPVYMMSIGGNDLFHGFPHCRQDKHITLRQPGCLFALSKCRPTLRKRIEIKTPILFAHLLPKVVMVVDDGPELFHQFVPFFHNRLVTQIGRICSFLLWGQISVSGDQFTDALFHHGPCQKDFRRILGF